MRRFATLAALAGLCATPAPALDLPGEIDRTLWCASAFYWLAGSAGDAGDAGEAEVYDAWSHQLLDAAGDALAKAGFTAAEIDELVASYDERALRELGTEDAAYDVIACPGLLVTPVP